MLCACGGRDSIILERPGVALAGAPKMISQDSRVLAIASGMRAWWLSVRKEGTQRAQRTLGCAELA